ncbi:MAG: helix-turn-helix transcriptional regulator [Kiritimatiellae bacterium]|nr:helix-turn-helix transcriptional regulator [Kiritimatiellia bacterium]
MLTMKELGAFVSRTRKAQKVSQEVLAQAVGVGRRFIVELEAGKETLQTGKMLRVLDVLGIDVRLLEPRGY